MQKNSTSLWPKFYASIGSFMQRLLLLVVFFIIIRLFEVSYNTIIHEKEKDLLFVFIMGFLNDICFLLFMAMGLYIFYFLFYLLSSKAANVFFIIASILLCVIQLGLVQYFATTLVPLGADLFGYSFAEINQTVSATGGIKLTVIIAFIVIILLIIFSFRILTKKNWIIAPFHGICILFMLIACTWFNVASYGAKWKAKTEFGSNLTLNKSYFFYLKSASYFFPRSTDIDIYSDNYSGDFGDNTTNNITSFSYLEGQQFPFIHKDVSADVLSPFFDSSTSKPNIVFIIVEGLGRAFTNEGAYLGNFTPFIDSLSKQSLYWNNFLSEGGRTFAVLPSVFGSLPFGKNGFNEMGTRMPARIDLLNIFKQNGYHTGFYYGGDSHFDNMDIYMHKSNIDELTDEKTFPAGYKKMPAPVNEMSWGYGDKELVRRYFDLKKSSSAQPYVNVLLTVSTHSPFAINEQDEYFQRFEQRLKELGFDDSKKQQLRSYKNQFASILYLDDAIRNFFIQYEQQPDYKNTIFIITGDHRMPEIPMSTKLDRYHVPLIIFSPLLKRKETFASISTHYDITPSLVAMFKNQYGFQTPSVVSWMGSGLDTNRSFRNIHAYPLMQTKADVTDFIMGDKMLSGDEVFRITDDMNLSVMHDDQISLQLKGFLQQFKVKNERVAPGSKMLPDSILNMYQR